MFDSLLNQIRSRTRTEWYALLTARFADLRQWIHDNGEKAAFLAFFGGLFIAVFFKLFFLILMLGVIAGYLFWFIAPENKGPGGSN